LIPLLPLQTIRYRIVDFPLGNKLIDLLLLGVIVGALFRSDYRFIRTPMNKVLIFFGVFCYAEFVARSIFLNSALPWSLGDPRFSNLEELHGHVCAVCGSSHRDQRLKADQNRHIADVPLRAAVDKGFYGTMSDRDTSHFSYEVRDGGPLDTPGKTGSRRLKRKFILFLLGLNALQERKSYKLAIWGLAAFCLYCVCFHTP